MDVCGRKLLIKFSLSLTDFPGVDVFLAKTDRAHVKLDFGRQGTRQIGDQTDFITFSNSPQIQLSLLQFLFLHLQSVIG